MKKSVKNQIIWEKRILYMGFAAGILASLLFIISFSTEFWVYVSYPEVRYRDNAESNRTHYYKKGHYQGLWKICRQEFRNDSEPLGDYKYCRRMWIALPDYIDPKYWDLEKKILDLRSSTVAVGFISIILSAIANCFVYFSLDQLRYMFKRLAGCLELISGASAWVTIEVFKRAVYFVEELECLKYGFPKDSVIEFGWSYNLVWVVLILYMFDGVALLACSRKRKGLRARSMKEAYENEPVVLGRL